MSKIPSEYKCSYCKKDLRETAKDKDKCECNKYHPVSVNKSGGNIYVVEMEYKGTGDK